MQEAERHELFVHWLMMLLHDDRGRTAVRAMLEEHEMPVIDLARGATQVRPQS